MRKLKMIIRGILSQFFEETRSLQGQLDRANGDVANLSRRMDEYKTEMPHLKEVEKNYARLRRGLGDEGADRIIQDVKEQEAMAMKKKAEKREHIR